MELLFAPMEGITGQIFRQLHHQYFGGADAYYIPFVSPTEAPRFTKKDLAELLPERNQGIRAIPQLMTKRAADFQWAARALADMGYEEVNLNLGCPSGTVVAKGKGAGFLTDLHAARTFFDQIFQNCPIRVSVKTRLGLVEPEEFIALMELYNQYPICELILHPRIQKDLYRHPARREWLSYALVESRLPLCYNGDLNTVEELTAFQREFPQIERVMLGRGWVGDPALGRKWNGGAAATREELRGFHDTLFAAYRTAFQSDRNAMFRMKEVWFYLICLFEGGEKQAKKLRKATTTAAYEEAVRELMEEIPLRNALVPQW